MMMNPTRFKLLIEAIFTVCLILQVDLACGKGRVRCIGRERQALLDFKAVLVDEYGMLSSWEEKRDCCQWKGVRCSNLTGHILSLDLHGGIFGDEYTYDDRFLGGNKIATSLVELQQLRYLNLSWNDFTSTHIPEFFGSMTNLRYLDLSRSGFVGEVPSQLGSLLHLKYLDLSWNILEGSIPNQLGNLSSLQTLNLGGNLALKIDDKIDNGGQWLSNLTSLTHLDLGSVQNLNNSHNWLQMIAKLPKLRELHLLGCGLSDYFILSPSLSPSEFKFSTSLSVIDLSGNSLVSSEIFRWVSNVSSNLVELNLGRNNLFEGPAAHHFGTTMNSLERLYLTANKLKGGDLNSFMNMCSLQSLELAMNNLTEDLSSILYNMSSGCIRSSLQELDLSRNQITGTLPDDLSVFPSLKTFSISENQLKGKIPENILLPSQFESLDIGSNSLEGGIPKSFGNTCALISLEISNNSLSEELPVIIQPLSGCARYSLQELDLGNNQINGTLPDLSIFPSLKKLDLSQNRLNGKVPKADQFPFELEILDLGSNALEDVISDSHFAGMSKLKSLDLSHNSAALTFSNNWDPPFQLEKIYLGGCMLGPSFPKWLQTPKSLISLNISSAGISDVVPEWFWALSTKLQLMDISYNNLSGAIPNYRLKYAPNEISLAMNQFEGPIPQFFRRARSLDLSKNKFSDFVSFLCANGTTEKLGQLDISSNHLSGQIPDCWSKFISLSYIDLSNNNFSGQVPTSMGKALKLQVLILRNNTLTGELPLSLRSCTNLLMLDAGENGLSGVVPSWIGSSLSQLQMLSLRRNLFSRSLPLSLCYLKWIHLLDLSSNGIKGQIPKCFKNFTAMIQERSSIQPDGYYDYYLLNGTWGNIYIYFYDLIALLTWKGAERTFKNDKLLLKGIDLSSNQLSEDIPTELGNLVGLVSLNLSRNNLTGKIPWEIGRLVSLDALDLSRNHLFGPIPPSLAKIDRLSTLDLSHNNLSGMIPISTQLQSFNASSYEENQDLCGPPLDKMCLPEKPRQESFVSTQEDDHALFFQAFYMSMGLGFFAGFWVVFGTILFNRSWRHTYFRFLNKLTDKIMSRWQ